MAQIIMDQAVSWCLGTTLAPICSSAKRFSAANTTLSTWFKTLEVRQFKVTPWALSARSHGLMRTAPVIILVPEGFRVRFRANNARESSIPIGTTFFAEGVPKHRCSVILRGSGSEHRTTHHSHSASSSFSRYGEHAGCPMDCRASCAAFSIRRSGSISMTTLLHPKRAHNASRIDWSVSEGSHDKRILSARVTISRKHIRGIRGRRIFSTFWADRYLRPGMFCPYKNAANSLSDIARCTRSNVRHGVRTPCWHHSIKSYTFRQADGKAERLRRTVVGVTSPTVGCTASLRCTRMASRSDNR